GVTGYKVYRDGSLIATTNPAGSYSDTTILPGHHDYVARAIDGPGNSSDPSNTASLNVPDTEAPTPPLNLKATEMSSTRVDLEWDAATDNVGVTSYEIYREGTSIGTTGAGTSYSDTNVTP